MLRLLSLFITVALTAAFSPLQPVFQTFVSGALIGTPVLLFGLDPCKPNAKNCVFKTWTPPPGTSKSKAVKDLRSVIQSYPQQGQAEGTYGQDVDGGGWTIAVDQLDRSGTARVEYRSSGKGFFAKVFNGGKPFVDDLNIEVDGSGKVQIRSQSRIGESDLGVNAKRVSYLAALLKEKGWKI